jgi:predicted nucleic acid-binding protein
LHVDGASNMPQDSLNSFEKRMLTRPSRVIDASVILEAFNEAKFCAKEMPCNKFLDKAGYEYRPYITHSLLGEVLRNICFKVTNKELQLQYCEYVIDFAINRNVQMIEMSSYRDKYLEEFKQMITFIPVNDLIHLSNMLAGGFNEFVTIDEKMNGENIRHILQQNWKIKIINPRV